MKNFLIVVSVTVFLCGSIVFVFELEELSLRRRLMAEPVVSIMADNTPNNNTTTAGESSSNDDSASETINIDDLTHLLVHHNKMSADDEADIKVLEDLYPDDDQATDQRWKLPQWGAETWCDPPELPPLNYLNCNHSDIVNVIPLVGGLTNALKIILLGAVKSMAENRCFVVNEQKADLKTRKDKTQEFGSFIERYFEPIGLPWDSPIVVRAWREDRIHFIDVVTELLGDLEARRIYNSKHAIPQISDSQLEGHVLKKIVMRRLWRPLPDWRIKTCKALETYDLGQSYISFSVRRGDKKSVEQFEFENLNHYLKQADEEINRHFGGVPPKIFVATDDCSVLADFRYHRRDWTFVSECDRVKEEEEGNGFALKDVGSWTKEQTDGHFQKFFVELYAMAFSRIYIGVSYTNVAWWAYFMRPDRHSFRLIDKFRTTGKKGNTNVDYWRR